MPLEASQFAVEVCCPTSDDGTSGKTGTGFYVAPGYILTAAHTLSPSEGPEKDPRADLKDKAIVRLLAARDHLNGIFSKGKGWVEATRVWPVSDAYPARDIVLLQVNEAKLCGGVEIGKDDWQWRLSKTPQQREEEEVRLYGFPDYVSEIGKAQRSMHRLRKMFGRITKLENHGNLPYLTLSPNSPGPKTPDGWSAMSGAAVLKDNMIVGVVKTAISQARYASELEIEPVFPLRNDADFNDHLADLLSVEGERRTLSVAARPETVDRSAEIQLFGAAASLHYGASPEKHFVVLQPGHERDDLSNCIERYCYDVIGQIIRTEGAVAQHYSKPIIVNLSGPAIETSARVQAALQNWASHLSSDAPGFGTAEVYAAIIRENAPRQDTSRLIILQHDVGDLTDACNTVIAEVLKVLASLAPMSPPVYAFLKLSTGESSEPEDMRLRKIFFDEKRVLIDQVTVPHLERLLGAGDAGQHCCFIPLKAPGDCQRSDLQSWLSKAEAETGFSAKKLPGYEHVRQILVPAQVPQRTAIEELSKLTWKEADQDAR